MKEAPVEKRLKDGLEAEGFKVLKFTTPGTQFTPDRFILRPTWSPGAPWVVEVKRPGGKEQRGQTLTREEWRKRGVLVLDPVDTYEKVDALISELMRICRKPLFCGSIDCVNGCDGSPDFCEHYKDHHAS